VFIRSTCPDNVANCKLSTTNVSENERMKSVELWHMRTRVRTNLPVPRAAFLLSPPRWYYNFMNSNKGNFGKFLNFQISINIINLYTICMCKITPGYFKNYHIKNKKKITWILVKKREINGGKCSKHKT